MTYRDQRPRTGFRPCALLIAGVILLAAAEAAHAGTITIEWDRSPDPAVIGYRVSVGTSPGNYTQTFDVGSLTYFVYQARDTRQYYLAVASYTAGSRLGPLSPAVSAIPQGVSIDPVPSGITDARTFYGYLWSLVNTPVAGGDSVDGRRRVFRSTGALTVDSQVCWEPSTECLTVRTLTRRSARIASLARSADGRLFFIEDGWRIGEISASGLQSRVVLAGNSHVRLGHIGLDPRFAESGLMYVGETETYADGSREFRIVSYRVLSGVARERAVIVSLPLPFQGGDAVFAVGSTGHFYVALPTDSSAQQTEYSGMLLRFNADGTVPDDQRGTPVFATGYARPTAAAFDEGTLRLWLAGIDDRGQPSVSSLGESTSALSLSATSLATSVSTDGDDHLFVVSDAGGLGRALVEPGSALTSVWNLTSGAGLIRDVVADPSGDLFVVVEESSGKGTTSSILRLTSLR